MFKNLSGKNRRFFLVLLYFGIAPVLIGGIVSGIAVKYADNIRNLDFIIVFLINIFASFFLAAGFIPTTFYSLLSGYILGWSALPLILISYTAACSLGYWISKKIDNGNLLEIFQGKYDVLAFKSKLETSGFWIPALCRLSPALPFAVLNAVFAMVKYPFSEYMTGSMLGMLPRTVFAVYIGTGFTHVHSVEDLESDWSLWFAIVLGLFSFTGIGLIIKKVFK